jgi:hypothetical protein
MMKTPSQMRAYIFQQIDRTIAVLTDRQQSGLATEEDQLELARRQADRKHWEDQFADEDARGDYEKTSGFTMFHYSIYYNGQKDSTHRYNIVAGYPYLSERYDSYEAALDHFRTLCGQPKITAVCLYDEGNVSIEKDWRRK